MPYVSNSRRSVLETKLGVLEFLEKLKTVDDLEMGDLNYIISSVLVQLWESNKSYKTLNSMVGMLECTKLELYRRAGAPYEEAKAKLNGDVY